MSSTAAVWYVLRIVICLVCLVVICRLAARLAGFLAGRLLKREIPPAGNAGRGKNRRDPLVEWLILWGWL